ncbi:FAD binding domain-containing protein [Mycolicibacterium boenickei]
MAWYRPTGYRQLCEAMRSGAKVVGGGVGLSSPAFIGDLKSFDLIDTSAVLSDIVTEGKIAARTTLSTVAASAVVPTCIAQAAQATGNPNLRRRITVGGVLGWGSAIADLPVAFSAVDAQVICMDVNGAVTCCPASAVSMHQGIPRVIIEVRVPTSGASAYRRIGVRAGPAPALAAVAGYRGSADQIRLVAGAVAVRPICFAPDRRPDAGDMMSDHRGSARHRARLISRLTDLVLEDLEALDG